MMVRLNECIFWLNIMTYWTNIISFRIKSALILKNNLISNLPIINFFLKAEIKSYGDEVVDFHYKKIPKVGCNHTCLWVISLDSAFKKDNYYSRVFLKECKQIEKKVVRHIIDDFSFLERVILKKQFW